jgi:pseudouridine-5'-phosphate glycosidase
MDSAAEVAAFARTREALKLDGAVLLANPVPAEDEIPAAEIGGHIEAANRAAMAEGITGKAVTPYLLDKILTLTDGRSLATNIAIIRNNARVAAEVAVAMAK